MINDPVLYAMVGFVVGLLVGITFTAGTLILALTAKSRGCKACLHEGPYDGDTVCRERGCGCVCLGG